MEIIIILYTCGIQRGVLQCALCPVVFFSTLETPLVWVAALPAGVVCSFQLAAAVSVAVAVAGSPVRLVNKLNWSHKSRRQDANDASFVALPLHHFLIAPRYPFTVSLLLLLFRQASFSASAPQLCVSVIAAFARSAVFCQRHFVTHWECDKEGERDGGRERERGRGSGLYLFYFYASIKIQYVTIELNSIEFDWSCKAQTACVWVCVSEWESNNKMQ